MLGGAGGVGDCWGLLGVAGGCWGVLGTAPESNLSEDTLVSYITKGFL